MLSTGNLNVNERNRPEIKLDQHFGISNEKINLSKLEVIYCGTIHRFVKYNRKKMLTKQ